MARRTEWDDDDLLAALDRYGEELSHQALSPATVGMLVYYAGLFLRWRTGNYVPRSMPIPAERPVPAGKHDLAGLTRELMQYEAYLRSTPLRPGATRTYVLDATPFLRWLGTGRLPSGVRHLRSGIATRRATVVRTSSAVDLAAEFARIRENHQKAIVRTVARMALPGSVGRVFESGTTAALVALLPRLPVDELRDLSGQETYRAWFTAVLEPVSRTILQFNPRKPRSSVHPGYKWGHGTKVLSLFVRNLVVFSRYLTEDDARSLEPWLYCPVDRIVMDRLRRVGFDPGVDLIREIDEATF